MKVSDQSELVLVTDGSVWWSMVDYGRVEYGRVEYGRVW